MSPWQLESVQGGPRNLPLKFGQNRVNNSWDIADIEFVWGGWVVFTVVFVSNLQLQLRLGCSWVGVLTISYSTLPLPPIIVGVMSDQTVQTPNNKSSPPVMVAICKTSGTFQLEQAYGYYIGVKRILLLRLHLHLLLLSFSEFLPLTCSASYGLPNQIDSCSRLPS